MTVASIQSQPALLSALNVGGVATSAAPRVSADTLAIKASPEATSFEAPPVDAKQLEAAVQQVQDFTRTLANELKFNIDEDSGQTVVKIVDSSTEEVIRQIPSEEMLAIAKALDQIQGLLIKQKA
jgi:flagellar protein FlaG